MRLTAGRCPLGIRVFSVLLCLTSFGDTARMSPVYGLAIFGAFRWDMVSVFYIRAHLRLGRALFRTAYT